MPQNSRFNPRYSKAKGTAWETEIINYLLELGVQDAERRRLSGAFDKGDVGGIRNVVIEAKAERSYDIPGWLREAKVEATNAKADFGVVWAKRNGKTKAHDGFVLMAPETFLHLLREAGYLDPSEVPPVLSSNDE